MDPASVIGMAAAVVQLLDLGIKVAKRLNEYIQASPGDNPKSIENINSVLPLITRSLNQIKNEATIAGYDEDTRTILHGVVLGCLKLIRELDHISAKIVVQKGETIGVKMKKVLQSLKYEEKVQEIDQGLQAYIQVLILHQVVNKKEVRIRPSEEKSYFEVKEILSEESSRVERETLISQLHKCFSDTVQSLSRKPTTIVLQGSEGVGKSQLALQYCHKAYNLKYFPWVFWLQAASPTLLRLSLEHVASVFRQSTAGTTDEKIGFVKDYLASSWRPWLLVLDNYEHKAFDAEPLTKLVPDTGFGAMLITTRHEDMADLGAVIKVQKFLTPDDDRNFRRKVTKAIYNMDMSKVVDAITEGFNVDSYSHQIMPGNEEPLINIAAEQGFDEAVQLFLDMGANPCLDMMQLPALGAAVFNGNLSTVEIILNHEDSTGYVLSDSNWQHVTRYAVSKGNNKILELLLDRRGERIVLEGAWPLTGFEEAAEQGNLETLRLLLSRGKFPQPGRTTATALGKAIKYYKPEVIKFLLHEVRVDPNAIGDEGCTALYSAVGDGYKKMSSEELLRLMELLLEAGADINLGKPHMKATPLHRAAIEKLVPAVQLLLKHGADATLENESRENPLDYAASAANREEKPLLALADATITDADARRKYFTRGLFEAIRRGWRELALRMLEKADVDSVDEDTGSTPLAMAIKLGQLPMARMLARKNADQNIADKDGKVPLLLAAEKDMGSLIKELIKAKGSPGPDVGNEQGYTPLMLAAQAGHEKSVEILLGLGADRDVMNIFGDTALDIAEEIHHPEIIKLLEA